MAGAPAAAAAHDSIEREVVFECRVAKIAGSFVEPTAHFFEPPQPQVVSKPPCVVIVGGTMSNTRDGDMGRAGVPAREALRRLAEKLAAAGYASIRYDKVGFGKSTATPQWTGAYRDEAEVAASAIRFAREQKSVDRVAVIGESAGAYLACLAASAGAEADAYIFLGGHCGSGEGIFEYNFKRLADLSDSDPTWRAWAEKNARFELALGRHYQAMFVAANAGAAEVEIVDGDFRRKVGVARRKEELDQPPDEMFRFIRKPTLALGGEYDLNVPPDHAARIVERVREAGNHAVTCVQIAGADHSFQLSPDSEQERWRERYNFESFRREYATQMYEEATAWLNKTFGRATATPPGADSPGAARETRGRERAEHEPRTAASPARTFLAPGIQIVQDITDASQTAGVATLEGRIGPLLQGEGSQAHFIEMQAGLYCAEHPHSTESIIYTVRGRWVLCSHGRRQVMAPGSLFHFARGTPTGYETPFGEDAFILIFKGERSPESDDDFVAYLRGLASRLQREHDAGVPYVLKDLPADHPAIVFARQANADFDK